MSTISKPKSELVLNKYLIENNSKLKASESRFIDNLSKFKPWLSLHADTNQIMRKCVCFVIRLSLQC